AGVYGDVAGAVGEGVVHGELLVGGAAQIDGEVVDGGELESNLRDVLAEAADGGGVQEAVGNGSSRVVEGQGGPVARWAGDGDRGHEGGSGAALGLDGGERGGRPAEEGDGGRGAADRHGVVERLGLHDGGRLHPQQGERRVGAGQGDAQRRGAAGVLQLK